MPLKMPRPPSAGWAAYQVLSRKGLEDEFDFIAFGGDGGTYDIGLQSLSGAMEQGHNMLYVCYDNQAYANTGINARGDSQGASTTTTPSGRVPRQQTPGPEDLTGIMAAHNIPYVAQARWPIGRTWLAKFARPLR